MHGMATDRGIGTHTGIAKYPKRVMLQLLCRWRAIEHSVYAGTSEVCRRMNLGHIHTKHVGV
jgi:hypothetical protein